MTQHSAKRMALPLLAGLLSVVVRPDVRAQPPASPLASLREAESALTGLIARAEASIIAISHQPKPRAGTRPGAGLPGRNNNPFGPLGGDPFGGLRVAPLQSSAAPPSGAGVVIDRRGLILTQFLAISPGQQHRVTTIEGQSFNAEVKAADPRSGLAVLEVRDAGLTPLPIGKAETLRKGSFALTLGNPYAILADGQPTASIGTVTNLGQRVGEDVNLNNAPTNSSVGASYRTTLHHFGTLIQTDSRLGWNAAGGALVNLDGELIGVATTASTTAGHEQPAGYAIPLNKTFRRIVQTLSEGREVEYGMLGVQMGNSRGGGVMVQTSFAGGPAARAGIRPQDVITEIDGAPIRNAEELQLAVGSLPPDTPTPVSFLRGGQPQTTEVSLAKFHVAGAKIVTNRPPAWRGVRVDYSTALPPEQLVASNTRGLIDPRGCVVVSEVDPSSVSWKNGIRPGMFITHVGDKRVLSPKGFRDAVRNAEGSVKLRFSQGAGGDQRP